MATDIENPTPDQIAKWKKEWAEKGKSIHKVTTASGKVGYLHDPDRKTLSLAMTRIAQNNIVGGVEAVLNNCWLGGDESIKTDDKSFMGLASQIDKLIQTETVTLEKL
ncbi:MAG TPA: hypothetical protein PKC55_07450 [Dysgonomonas sp.]|uniref:hypothetical protein n=1 Tax=unclassified Dysgonomonas TaxID=2630389 RepID=UPI0025C670C5|nr:MULTISPECIES: hypothetical protein [unclassified Dysgonomonas]HML64647.1 hypothetical protein [Dysgonomonas sp.]